MNPRLNKLRNYMEQEGLDICFIQSYANRFYFSNFTGSNGYLLISQQKAVLITDQRYTEQASKETKFEVLTHGIDRIGFLLENLKPFDGKKIGFEEETMSAGMYLNFKDYLPHVTLHPIESTLLDFRKVKSTDEIELVKKAIEISDKAFHDLTKVIKPGITEKEIAIELEYFIGKHGGDSLSFGTIVAFGERSALPHAKPNALMIHPDHFLIIDFGVAFKGYMSDMTRTLWVGEPSKELQRIYNLVLEALDASISYVKPNITCHELDEVARDVFRKSGLEEYSLRGLGHGVGLEIHENPRVVLNNKSEIIEENMIFTIEPGLYIPQLGGVRIEDMVHVTKNGCKVLTKSDRTVKV